MTKHKEIRAMDAPIEIRIMDAPIYQTNPKGTPLMNEAILNELRMMNKALEARSLDTTIIQNVMPVYGELLVPRLASGFLNVLRNVDNVPATKLSLAYSTQVPSLQAFTGQTSDQSGSLQLGGVTLQRQIFTTLVEMSNEILNDSGVDLEKYINALYTELTNANKEHLVLTAVAGSSLTTKVTEGTSGTLAFNDIQNLLLSVSGNVRRNSIIVASDAQEMKIANMTYGTSGQSILNYNTSDNIPEILGVDVYFAPSSQMPSNTPVVMMDKESVLCATYFDGDTIQKLTEAYMNLDVVGYLLTSRVASAVNKANSTAMISTN